MKKKKNERNIERGLERKGVDSIYERADCKNSSRKTGKERVCPSERQADKHASAYMKTAMDK